MSDFTIPEYDFVRVLDEILEDLPVLDTPAESLIDFEVNLTHLHG